MLLYLIYNITISTVVYINKVKLACNTCKKKINELKKNFYSVDILIRCWDLPRYQNIFWENKNNLIKSLFCFRYTKTICTTKNSTNIKRSKKARYAVFVKSFILIMFYKLEILRFMTVTNMFWVSSGNIPTLNYES